MILLRVYSKGLIQSAPPVQEVSSGLETAEACLIGTDLGASDLGDAAKLARNNATTWEIYGDWGLEMKQRPSIVWRSGPAIWIDFSGLLVLFLMMTQKNGTSPETCL